MHPLVPPGIEQVSDKALGVFAPAARNVRGMAESLVGSLPQILVGLLVFWLALKLARRARDWARRVVSRAAKGGEDAAGALGQLTYGAVVVGGVAVAAAVMGIGLGNVLAGIGVSGVVAGFAFKDILENYLAGVLLMLTRPFSIGDVVKTGEFEGTVRAISTRSTVIETADGLLVVVPNARIYSSPLTNYSSLPNRRASVSVRVTYERDLEDLRRDIEALVARSPAILAEPKPEILTASLDERTVTLEVRYWTRRADAHAARSTLLAALKQQIYGDRPPAEPPIAGSTAPGASPPP